MGLAEFLNNKRTTTVKDNKYIRVVKISENTNSKDTNDKK